MGDTPKPPGGRPHFPPATHIRSSCGCPVGPVKVVASLRSAKEVMDMYMHVIMHMDQKQRPCSVRCWGAWPFRLRLVMRCWTHWSTLPAPFVLYEWSGTGCSGRWSVQPGGPTGAGGELMCQRRGKRCADPLCMQHCVEARSGTMKRLRGVRGVRGSWCGAMNGGRDGWGDSLASFPSRRRRRKNSAVPRNAQWASHSTPKGRFESCLRRSGLSKLPPPASAHESAVKTRHALHREKFCMQARVHDDPLPARG